MADDATGRRRAPIVLAVLAAIVAGASLAWLAGPRGAPSSSTGGASSSSDADGRASGRGAIASGGTATALGSAQDTGASGGGDAAGSDTRRGALTDRARPRSSGGDTGASRDRALAATVAASEIASTSPHGGRAASVAPSADAQPARISGIVLDESSHLPLALVRVEARSGTDPEAAPVATTRTGEDGRFLLEGLAPGAIHVKAEPAEASGTGFLRVEVAPGALERVTIEISWAVVATAIVRDAAGVPLAGEHVVCFDTARQERERLGEMGEVGRYNRVATAGVPLRFWVERDGVMGPVVERTFSTREVCVVELTAPPRADLTIHVLVREAGDDGPGRPISGARVRTRHERSVSAEADRDGRARLEHVSSVSGEIEALAPGFAPVTSEIGGAGRDPAAPLVMLLRRSPEAVMGHVMDRGGRAVEGVVVAAYAGGGGEVGRERARATTGPYGSFRLEGLVGGDGDLDDWVWLRAIAPEALVTPRSQLVRWHPASGYGYDPLGRRVQSTPVLVVGLPPLLRFRLVAPEGSPPPQGTVMIFAGQERGHESRLGTARLDPEGRGALLMPAERRGAAFAIETPGFPLAWFISVVGPGDPDPPEVLVLLPLPARVSGRVVDAAGAPRAGAAVRAIAHAPPSIIMQSKGVTFTRIVASTGTDAAGRFSLGGLPSSCAIAAEAAGGLEGGASFDDLEPGAPPREIEILLQPERGPPVYDDR